MKLLTACSIFGRRIRVLEQIKRTMSSGYLVNDPKYSFLKDLGLQNTNAGVFDGEKWGGSGQVGNLFPH